MIRGEGRSWRVAGPFVIPLTMGLAIFGAFTQYAHPIVDVWSERVGGPPREFGAQLYAMARDGSAQTRLAILPGDVRSPRLSPDGRQLAYVLGTTEGQDTDRPTIHVRALDGSGDRTLPIDGGGFGPAWSPDGSRIAFGSRMAGQIDMFVIDADGTDLRRLTNTPGDDWVGAWLPDGSGLVFTSNRTGQFHLYRMAADGSDVMALTSGPSNDWDPTLSPDGRRIAFTTDRGEQTRIWVAYVDGSNPTELATGEGNAVMPAWSPDGGSIAFTSHRTGDEEVFLVAAAGGEPTNLTRNPGVDDGIAGPSWSADGRSILYPSEGATAADREPFVREGLGAAGILIYASILGGGLTFARRRGRLPAGTYLLLVAVPPILATVFGDEWRFIPGAVTAGVIAELLAAAFPPGSSRRADAAFAFAVPATFFACYFATVALTTGIGWSIHLWLGSIAIAGIIGLFFDELGARRLEGYGTPAG
jgi:Tol biopolymer transport system component